MRRLNKIGISADAIALAYDPPCRAGLFGVAIRGDGARGHGLGRDEFLEVGAILADALAAGGEDPDGSLAGRVGELTRQMPLYPYLA